MPDPKKYRMRVGGYSQHPGDVPPPAPRPKDSRMGTQLHPALDPNSSLAELRFQRAKDAEAARNILDLALSGPATLNPNIRIAGEQTMGDLMLDDNHMIRMMQVALADSAMNYRQMANLFGEEEAARMMQEARNGVGVGRSGGMDPEKAAMYRRLIELLPPNENLIDVGRARSMQMGRTSKYRNR